MYKIKKGKMIINFCKIISRNMAIDIKKFGGDEPEDNLRRVLADKNLEEDIVKYIEELIESEKYDSFGVVQMDMDKSKEIRSRGIGYKITILNEINLYLESNFSHICKMFTHGTRDDLTFIFVKDNLNIVYIVEKVKAILKGIAEQDFGIELDGGPYKITYSAGVSMYPMNGKSATDLLWLADGAVRKAKENGRNKVLIAEEGFHYITKTSIDSVRMRMISELSMETGKTLQMLYREGLEELFEKHSSLYRFVNLRKGDQVYELQSE